MALTAKGFGLKLKLKKSWVLKTKKTLNPMGSISLLRNAKNGYKSTRLFKPRSRYDLASGWIGTILITRCLMKTITLFGIFSKNAGRMAIYIKDEILWRGVQGV